MFLKKVFVSLLVVVAAAIGLYFWWEGQRPPLQELEAIAPPPGPPVQAEPAIRYPVPEDKAAKAALPELEDSDPATLDSLTALLGKKWVADYVVPRSLVRHIVVTVDNLPRQKVAVRLLPTKSVPGAFKVATQEGKLTIDPRNAQRYLPFVRAAESMSAKDLVATYIRLYPLFQRAYEELGYPDGYFNDRLVDVIDHMLAAPELEPPVSLVQPHIVYKFADPDLEAESAGHKIMARMGGENAARTKAKLRAIRDELTREGGPPRPATSGSPAPAGN